MNNLIEYTPEKPDMFIRMVIESPILLAILYTSLMIIIFLRTLRTIFKLSKVYEESNSKIKDISKHSLIIFFNMLILITMMLAIPKIDNKINYYRESYEPKPIALTNIKDNIIVENNKVIIKPLEQNYNYKDDKFDKTKEQTFKIEYDEFYNKYFLMDPELKRHEISKEDYEMLKNK